MNRTMTDGHHPRVARATDYIRSRFFYSGAATALTIATTAILVAVVVKVLEWGVFNAVWTVPHDAAGRPQVDGCNAVQGTGACWAVLTDRYRLILFGRYPYEEQWRPALTVALLVFLYGVSMLRRFWRKELLFVWAAALILVGVLMWGGVAGLPYVSHQYWGGLPITLILATVGLAGAFPLGLLVALGRRSTSLPGVRYLCVGYVELIRGVPLISLLFMASALFPLFLPVGGNVDKLLRAQIAIMLYAAAYLAEVVRGGLQTIDAGQGEAAKALGLGYWQSHLLVILPQALRKVIPSLVNTFITLFKDTSLVFIVGVFDLMTSGNAAISDPQWQNFSFEVYAFLGVIYLIFCTSMYQASRRIDGRRQNMGA